MSVQSKPAVSAIAVLAAAFSLPLLAPHSAANADTCLTAPNKQAPQGSHWYYRLERPSMRKCWRLVQKDQKEQRAAKQVTPPQGDDDPEEAAAAPADRPAATDPKPAPAPVVRTLVTRPVSNTIEATQPPPEPAATIANAPTPVERAPSAQQAPAQQVDQPAPQRAVVPPQRIAAPQKTVEADSGATPGWGTLLAAIGLLGLLAGASYAALCIVRRRTDVLNAVQTAPEDEDQGSFDHRPPVAASEAPTFAPLPPMATIAGEDDVGEALRRVRRRAA
jgi:hypothetical protein